MDARPPANTVTSRGVVFVFAACVIRLFILVFVSCVPRLGILLNYITKYRSFDSRPHVYNQLTKKTNQRNSEAQGREYFTKAWCLVQIIFNTIYASKQKWNGLCKSCRYSPTVSKWRITSCAHAHTTNGTGFVI